MNQNIHSFVSPILFYIFTVHRTGRCAGNRLLIFTVEITFVDDINPTKNFEQNHNDKHFEKEEHFPGECPLLPIGGSHISHEPKEFDHKYTNSGYSSNRISLQVCKHCVRNTQHLFVRQNYVLAISNHSEINPLFRLKLKFKHLCKKISKRLLKF